MANKVFVCSLKLAGTLLLTAFVTTARAQSVTQWDESVSGNLSGNQAAPNNFTLVLGTNAIIGNLRVTSAGDNQDWIMLAVPGGLQLSAVVLKAYSSTDAQGFTGVQAGTNFVGSALSAASYLGYAHFGTGAQNGALAPTNLSRRRLARVSSAARQWQLHVSDPADGQRTDKLRVRLRDHGRSRTVHASAAGVWLNGA